MRSTWSGFCVSPFSKRPFRIAIFLRKVGLVESKFKVYSNLSTPIPSGYPKCSVEISSKVLKNFVLNKK